MRGADRGAELGGEGEGPRSRILGRIAAALATRGTFEHPGTLSAPLPTGAEVEELMALLASSLTRSGGEVVRFTGLDDARSWLAGFASDFEGAVVSPDVPAVLAPGLPGVASAEAGLGVSVALSASASTGSLLLSSREGRALQLLPPVHLVWVNPASVHRELGAALQAAKAAGPLPAVLALHSGPSKSADIGRVLVTGVHGPGRLVAALVPFAPGDG